MGLGLLGPGGGTEVEDLFIVFCNPNLWPAEVFVGRSGVYCGIVLL